MTNLSKSLCLAALLSIALSCKKDKPLAPDDITYEKLGDLSVRGIAGFARNGEPLSLNNDDEVVRYRASSNSWVRLATDGTLPALATTTGGICEDAAGNFYGPGNDTAYLVLPVGGTAWARLSLPGLVGHFNQQYDSPVANAAGDVAFDLTTYSGGNQVRRTYGKPAGGTAWTQFAERPFDYYRPQRLTEGGHLIFANTNTPGDGPKILRQGTATLVQMADCGGLEILPYCNFQHEASPSGEVAFHQGGTGSRTIYRMAGGASYPATAQEAGTLPDGIASFFDFNVLASGAMMGMANDGGQGEYYLYIRKGGASGWTKAPTLPGGGYVYVRVNAQGEAYTASSQAAGSNANVYRIKF